MKWFACFLLSVGLLTGCSPLHPMKIAVVGPGGTPFRGSYTVDGIYQSYTGVMPATVEFTARDLDWRIERQAGTEPFRVESYVGEIRCTSTESSNHRGIRGALETGGDREKYWAEPFD